mmetsp:Transcript_22803/g.65755  ORF Transcript_22803/g.65755 Transcript_22803/m.65755 type:complete len:219 (+) Transcript_22803:2991-3647(+)
MVLCRAWSSEIFLTRSSWSSSALRWNSSFSLRSSDSFLATALRKAVISSPEIVTRVSCERAVRPVATVSRLRRPPPEVVPTVPWLKVDCCVPNVPPVRDPPYDPCVMEPPSSCSSYSLPIFSMWSWRCRRSFSCCSRWAAHLANSVLIRIFSSPKSSTSFWTFLYWRLVCCSSRSSSSIFSSNVESIPSSSSWLCLPVQSSSQASRRESAVALAMSIC